MYAIRSYYAGTATWTALWGCLLIAPAFIAAAFCGHQMLNEQERKLLVRLSVFIGGFSLEGAEAVCAGVITSYSIHYTKLYDIC